MKPATSVRALLLVGVTLIAPPASGDALRAQDAAVSGAAAPDDALRDGFRNPPMTARPRVWWHWMNGNITKDGIAKDLDWMKRAGLGGLQNFDADLITPKVVDTRLPYMSPGWKDAFRFAATRADQLGLELGIAASAGWSETGGPWVTPADAMKKLVWSVTLANGGRRFTGTLAQPPSTTGPFQDLAGTPHPIGPAKEAPRGYADVKVLAFRVAVPADLPAPTMMTGAATALDTAAMTDASFSTGVSVPRGTVDAPTTIKIDYDRPQTVRSLSLYIPGVADAFADPSVQPRLEASADGQIWRRITDIRLGTAPTTVGFAPVTAARFRLILNLPKVVAASGSRPASGFAGPPPGIFAGRGPLKIVDLRLSAEPRVNQYEAKAGFAIMTDYYALDGDVGGETVGVDPASVIDLTTRLRPDGTLDWTPSRGRWKIIRFGWSLTGATNAPASAEATGLEVDKLDGGAVRRYLDTYLGHYRDTVGPDLIGARGIRALVTDSTEVGAFNWTPRMLEQFQRLRGYDATPWLPALTGTIIESRARTDAFLFDFRRTIADLHASEHYGTVALVAHAYGLTVYGEALEAGRPSLGDDLDMRSHADVPMAALWMFRPEDGPRPVYLSDMRGAASVAHLFGQNLVAAESMTSSRQPWAQAPSDLRHVADREFASGINRPVIHTSVHQPVDKKPGVSLLFFGQFFTRNETWAEMARPWIDYLARNSFLLQQGRFVADVAYFYGEEAPTVAQTEKAYFTDVPTHYGYDFVNPTAVRNLLKVEGSDLVAAGGARYRVLYLTGTSTRMTLPMLRRIATLAESGATIVGNPPVGSPALGETGTEYTGLVNRLWSGLPVTEVGHGRVIAGKNVEAALQLIGVKPDVDLGPRQTAGDLAFVHRELGDGHLYFVTNRRQEHTAVEARFRVVGKVPEIWRADTGTITPVSYRIENGETIVPLSLESEDSEFVVFRAPATAKARIVPQLSLDFATALQGPWQVAFETERGAPAEMTVPSLVSLSDQQDPGIKYFSGVATYRRSFALPQGYLPGSPLVLDLGRVGDIAEVRVNGVVVGTAWHAPFALDIGKAARRGRNRLEIRVANLWVNRLIGDAQPGASKVTFTTMPTYRADAPLRPSGLIGPVRLMTTVSR